MAYSFKKQIANALFGLLLVLNGIIFSEHIGIFLIVIGDIWTVVSLCCIIFNRRNSESCEDGSAGTKKD